MAALAGWMVGKTVVPLNYLLRPDELQFVVDDCGTDTILTVGPLLDHLGVAPRVKHLVKLEDISFTGFPDARWPALASDDDLAVILYTSGTSGRPKGVMLTHGNLSANVRQIVEWVDFQHWGGQDGARLEQLVRERYVRAGTACGGRAIWVLRDADRATPEPDCHAHGFDFSRGS